MASCERCGGTESPYAGRREKKADGPVKLLWLCRGCDPCSTYVPAPAPKPRGFVFYRRLTYQIIIPIAALIFAMVEAGLHL